MSIIRYRGYVAEGLAEPNGSGGFESHGRALADGGTIQEQRLGSFDDSERAQYRGLQWACALIDTLPYRPE